MRSLLSDVAEEHRFILVDGTSISNLVELSIAIPALSQEQFNSHVDDAKNDFLNWIRDCIHDSVLVKALSGKNDRKSIQNIISKRVYELKKPKVAMMLGKLKEKQSNPEKPQTHQPEKSHQSSCCTPTRTKEFMMGLLMGILLGIILAGIFF